MINETYGHNKPYIKAFYIENGLLPFATREMDTCSRDSTAHTGELSKSFVIDIIVGKRESIVLVELCGCNSWQLIKEWTFAKVSKFNAFREKLIEL